MAAKAILQCAIDTSLHAALQKERRRLLPPPEVSLNEPRPVSAFISVHLRLHGRICGTCATWFRRFVNIHANHARKVYSSYEKTTPDHLGALFPPASDRIVRAGAPVRVRLADRHPHRE